MGDKTTEERIMIREVTGPQIDIIRDLSLVTPPGYLEIGPENVLLPSFYAKWQSKYTSFPVYPDDVWVVTFPKSGTTWTQEVVWCLVKDTKSPEASLEMMKRFPFLELDTIRPPTDENFPFEKTCDVTQLTSTWDIIEKLKAPRTIKSHLPKELLPKQLWNVKPKIVYVCRDPRDACVSFYFHSVRHQGFHGTINQFVDIFLDDKMYYSPYWRHVLNFWKMRHEEHILFLRYEDMKKDLAAIVRQVANFLGKEVDEEQVAWLTNHCSFSEMKNNPATNNATYLTPPTEESKKIKFMRNGKVGDWRNHLNKEQLKAFKTWTLQFLEGSDFPYYQDYD
ncbi:luciferin sulfotransferase [Procambarus clarkii]|uniref:luciferin sulfotransferase n=1 Tax=Procambarus clarkii TaxID=6728 RepID=UPI001E673892|nr:luciferin sulfotransferase-like [Procambarus clarkii]